MFEPTASADAAQREVGDAVLDAVAGDEVEQPLSLRALLRHGGEPTGRHVGAEDPETRSQRAGNARVTMGAYELNQSVHSLGGRSCRLLIGESDAHPRPRRGAAAHRAVGRVDPHRVGHVARRCRRRRPRHLRRRRAARRRRRARCASAATATAGCRRSTTRPRCPPHTDGFAYGDRYPDYFLLSLRPRLAGRRRVVPRRRGGRRRPARRPAAAVATSSQRLQTVPVDQTEPGMQRSVSPVIGRTVAGRLMLRRFPFQRPAEDSTDAGARRGDDRRLAGRHRHRRRRRRPASSCTPAMSPSSTTTG